MYINELFIHICNNFLTTLEIKKLLWDLISKPNVNIPILDTINNTINITLSILLNI